MSRNTTLGTMGAGVISLLIAFITCVVMSVKIIQGKKDAKEGAGATVIVFCIFTALGAVLVYYSRKMR